mmetsp:Transcript_33951/g.97795  ORF Transcript_33951/g.97795 Transcript_33951/m.97795 type:complete len:200 (+) Transcript_33951:64-663(+)
MAGHHAKGAVTFSESVTDSQIADLLADFASEAAPMLVGDSEPQLSGLAAVAAPETPVMHDRPAYRSGGRVDRRAFFSEKSDIQHQPLATEIVRNIRSRMATSPVLLTEAATPAPRDPPAEAEESRLSRTRRLGATPQLPGEGKVDVADGAEGRRAHRSASRGEHLDLAGLWLTDGGDAPPPSPGDESSQHDTAEFSAAW